MLVLCVIGGAQFFMKQGGGSSSSNNTEYAAVEASSCSDYVTMYSQTNCSVCKAVKHRLRQASIPFRSYDIDRDPALQKSFAKKAFSAGITTIQIPTFEVGGKILSGRTPVEQLKPYLCSA